MKKNTLHPPFLSVSTNLFTPFLSSFFACSLSLQKKNRSSQDLSSWSSADELDTSGSLSPVSGRSTPSRRRSVTYTPPWALYRDALWEARRGQAVPAVTCAPETPPFLPTSPINGHTHPCHPRVSPSTPLSTTCFTLPPSDLFPLSSLLLFFACDLSLERVPPEDGEPYFPALGFLFLFLSFSFFN